MGQNLKWDNVHKAKLLRTAMSRELYAPRHESKKAKVFCEECGDRATKIVEGKRLCSNCES